MRYGAIKLAYLSFRNSRLKLLCYFCNTTLHRFTRLLNVRGFFVFWPKVKKVFAKTKKKLILSSVQCDPTPYFVGPFVRRPVRHTLLFLFFEVFGFTAPKMIMRPQVRLYNPCPPARDWGSHVSGLVF